MNGRSWSTRALVMLVALALGLTGCARIPDEGGVQQGVAVTAHDEQDTLYYPGSPAPGAGPEEILRGFLAAGTGTSDNYGVAREFMTPPAAISWDATASTLVVDADPTIHPFAHGAITVSMNVVATVDAHGRYTELSTMETRTLEYTLEQVDGEWRIASAPAGIVLLKQNFANIFAPFTLAFLDQSRTYVVPEIRWFPSHVTAPTRIVQALLSGPSDWLAEGGVNSAFPRGTQLLGPILPDQGNAAANFSTNISGASGDEFSLMQLQLEESLADFSNIETVSMLVNGARIDVSLPAEGTVVAHSQVSTQPLVMRGGSLGYLAGDTVTPIVGTEGLQTTLPNLHATAGSVSGRVAVAAFLTQDQGVVAVPFAGGAPVPIDDREDLLPPTVSQWGFVWTMAPEDHVVRVADPVYGFGTDVPLPPELQGKVKSLSLSRSGAMMAFAAEINGKAAIATMAVKRDPSTGRPLSLGTPQIDVVDASRAIDLTWADQTTIGLLASAEKGGTQVFVRQLGGTTTEYGGVDGGVAIEGSNTRQGLRICNGKGDVFVPRASQWQASGARVDFLVAQN